MWKIQNFSATQILREIKVGESRVSKLAILAYLEAQNFDFYEFLYFLTTKIYQINKTQIPKIAIIGSFKISRLVSLSRKN